MSSLRFSIFIKIIVSSEYYLVVEEEEEEEAILFVFLALFVQEISSFAVVANCRIVNFHAISFR